MRVLNMKLRKSIIDKAIEEFYNYGYQRSSLRRIVKNAGTTIGNFYNYFKSKEELYYTITEPIYNNIMYYAKYHHNMIETEFGGKIPLNLKSIRLIIKVYLERAICFEKPFIILLTASEGTRYENVWNVLIEVFSKHFKEQIKELSLVELPLYNDMDITPELAKSILHGMLQSLLYILKTDKSKEEKIKHLTDCMLIYFFGMIGLQ